jgi:hypothetical protein
MADKQNEGKLMTVHTWNGEKQKASLNFVVEGRKCLATPQASLQHTYQNLHTTNRAKKFIINT